MIRSRNSSLTRLAAFLGVAALAISAAGGGVGAAEMLNVGKAVPTAYSFTPLDIGIESGIFARHGLEVKSHGMGGSARLQQGLIGGNLDIGLGAGPELAFVAKGAPVRGVAAMAGPPLLLVIVVREDAGIKTVDDLKGKIISVSTAGSLTEWLVKELSRQKGWGPDGIKATPLGAPTAQVAALRTKQTHGQLTDLGLAYNLEKQGVGKTLLNFGDYVKDFHIHVIYANTKMIKERPDAVRKFLAAWFETIEFMIKNKDKSIAISGRVMNTPPDVTSRIYDKLMPMFSRDGKFDQKALAVLRKSFVELGTLDKEPDMSKTYTEEFLPKTKPGA
jgi:ABC-type nitrate/sulfonate/bicarbonate transport system substrate-binding protein